MTAATVGGETSIMRSASWASSSRGRWSDETGLQWRPGPCEHCLEVFGGTTPGEKVVKHGPGSPQGVAEGGGAAGRASYLPTPQSGRAAVGVSAQRLQSS